MSDENGSGGAKATVSSVQAILLILVAVIGAGATWLLKVDDRVHEVAQQSVTRDDFDRRLSRIEAKLDRVLELYLIDQRQNEGGPR